MLERKHRVYGAKGKEDLLFPSKGFPPGASEKGDDGAPKTRGRKVLFRRQIVPGGDRLHIGGRRGRGLFEAISLPFLLGADERTFSPFERA